MVDFLSLGLCRLAIDEGSRGRSKPLQKGVLVEVSRARGAGFREDRQMQAEREAEGEEACEEEEVDTDMCVVLLASATSGGLLDEIAARFPCAACCAHTSLSVVDDGTE